MRSLRHRDAVNPVALADQRMLLSALADQRMVSSSVANLRAELNLRTDPIRAQLELPPDLELLLAALEVAFPPNQTSNNLVITRQGRQ